MWLILLAACSPMDAEAPQWPGGTLDYCVGWESGDQWALDFDPTEEGGWSFSGAGTGGDLHSETQTFSLYDELHHAVCWEPMAQYVEITTEDGLVAWLGWTVTGPDGADLTPALDPELSGRVEMHLEIDEDWFIGYRPVSAWLSDSSGVRLFLSNTPPWRGHPLSMRWGESTGDSYTCPGGFIHLGIFLEVTAVGGGSIAPGAQRQVWWEGVPWTVRNHGLSGWDVENSAIPAPDLPPLDQPVLAWR